MRIFLDANVLFSAAYSDGAVRRLFADIQGTGHTVVADRYVIEEAIRNLSIHRPEAIRFFHAMTTSLTVVPTRQWSEEIPPDITLPEKDVPVLAGAIAATLVRSMARLSVAQRSVHPLIPPGHSFRAWPLAVLAPRP